MSVCVSVGVELISVCEWSGGVKLISECVCGGVELISECECGGVELMSVCVSVGVELMCEWN